MGSQRFGVLWGGLLCLVLVPASRAAAPVPNPETPSAATVEALKLTARINRHVEALWADRKVPPAPLADDAEFLRRIYLDIAGRIPRVSEVHRFLDDKAPQKREREVERLLEEESHFYVNHFTNIWRTLLVPQSNNQQFQFVANTLDVWLRKKLRDNTPYDQVVRELMTTPVVRTAQQGGRPVVGAPGAEPTPLAFYQANEYKPENLAAATSRLFLGVKLECAQCHDHPFAKWTRNQFWEYTAFFAGITTQGRGGAFGPAQDKPEVRELTIPGTEKKVQARFLDGKEPEWKSDKGTRQTLAEWMTTADNPFFARAAANRVWAHLFGLGLIEPVDEMIGAETVVTHQELLDELAKEFAAHQFDIKYLIRAITASKAYQLTSALTDPMQADVRLLARMNLKGLTPEQLFDSLAMATGYREAANPNQRLSGFGISTPRGDFLQRFANHSDKKTEHTTSILQALSLMNGKFVADSTDVVQSYALGAILDAPFFDTTEKKIEALHLATLSRKPRPAELERLVKYVDRDNPSGDRKKALADVLWVLLNSSEFILNH